MTPELRQRISAILVRLKPLTADKRAAELDRLRTSEPEVAAGVESLLAAQGPTPSFDLNSREGIKGRDNSTVIADNRRGTDERDTPTVVADNREKVYEVNRLRPPLAGPTEDPDATPPVVPGCVLKGGKENLRFGGMGVVYFGTDSTLGRPVAVKVLQQRFANNSEYVVRFEAEARVTAQLQHPGIVPVHQIGRLADGRLFYTMKRVRGETFSEVLKRRPSPTADLLGILGQFRSLCEAMAYAHARNVLHRDLKPLNVMVGEYGEVLLMDWGVAKLLGDQTTPEPTPEPASRTIDLGVGGDDRQPTRGALGTMPYMPPEQAAGLVEKVDKRSDVFGLGAILCTILTGKPPYIGADNRVVEQKALEANLYETYHRLAGCGADVELVALTRKCLSPLREDRPADGEEVAKAVRGYLAGVEERRRQAELDRVKAEAEAREQKKRRRVQLALAAAIGLLVVGLGGFAWWEDKRATDRRVETENRERDESERDRVERDRVDRNMEALTGWVGACEAALRTDDTKQARAALAEADRRKAEGGGEAVAERLGRCRVDLKILTELHSIDTFRWTLAENKYPDVKVVLGRWRKAFEQFGIVPGRVPEAESARRVIDSLVRDRLLIALDLWLVFEPSAGVRGILRAADPNGYREGIRDAILVGRKSDLVERVGQAEALKQPAWFAAVLGHVSAVPVVRKREVMEVALQDRPGDLTLLMNLGLSYPINQREGAEHRLRWFQAAVAAHPGNSSAHNCLGNTLQDMGELDGAIRAYNAAIQLDPKFTYPHHGLGNALKAKGELDGAIREYETAIKLDSKYANPHNGLGNVLYTKQDLDGAIREYETAIKLDSKYANPHNGLGNVLYTKQDLDGAIREYETAIKLDSKYANPHNGLGNVLYTKQDLDGAIREYETAIKLDPKYANPHTGLGNVLFNKKELDSAILEYKAAIALDPKDAYHHNGLANVLYTKQDLDGAIREYEATIALDPRYTSPHIGLGNVLFTKKDFEGAIREYENAIKLDPKDASAHTGLGNVLFTKKDFEGAIREYENAIKLDPKYTSAHTGLGNVLSTKKDYEGAIREYEIAIKLDPTSAAAHANLANTLKSKGILEGAIREYEIAIKLDPTSAAAHTGLGNALKSKRDLEGAIREYNTAIKLDPSYALPHTGMGNVFYDTADLDGAIREYKTAIKLDPKDAVPHTRLGITLAKKKELDGAIREFKIAIKLDPKDFRTHTALGFALSYRGDVDGAIREFKIAIKLDPTDALTHTALGSLLKMKGDVDGAIREYTAAITLDPDIASMHTDLGSVLYDNSDWDGAIREYKAAITLDSKQASNHNNLGNALKAKGDLEGAIAAFREAARLKNRWAPTYHNLAVLLAARGESNAALQVLRDGLQVDPQFINNFRFSLACYTCLIASGQGKDLPPQIDRPGFRRNALAYLTDELAAQRKLTGDAKNKPVIHTTMLHWLATRDLDSVRDVDKLPAEEREGWAKVWADVRQLRDDTAPRPIAPSPRLVK